MVPCPIVDVREQDLWCPDRSAFPGRCSESIGGTIIPNKQLNAPVRVRHGQRVEYDLVRNAIVVGSNPRRYGMVLCTPKSVDGCIRM